MHIQKHTLLLAAILAFAGCLGASAPENETISANATPLPTPMRIVASDYAFEAPRNVEEGVYDITLENGGTELHHVGFYKIDATHTADDLRAALVAQRGGAPTWAVAYGGPNVATPGAPTSAIVRLDPGEYVLVCIIPSSDHEMHLAKGMTSILTVVPAAKDASDPDPSEGSPTGLPEADVQIELSDFRFDMSALPTTGSTTMRIVNNGPHVHELVAFELFGNATTMEFVEAIESGRGPPPGRPVGGIAPISPGREAVITLDLTPGRYTFVCFDNDGTSQGEPHLALGMIREFTVGGA